MEGLDEFFINYGYIGMAMAAFLSGSVLPFSSEAVLGVLLAASHMDPWLTVLSATVGNVGGSMLTYYMGRMCSMKTISKWLKVKEKRILKTKEYIDRKGTWIALFAFLPVVGEAISIALGTLRTNVLMVLLYTTVGKLIRYIVVAYTVLAIKDV